MDSAPDLELVCFDLGGVVVEICRSWEEGCARAGIALAAPLEPAWLAAFEEHSRRLQRGEISEAEVARGVSVATGGAYSAVQVEAVLRAWLKEPYAGVAEVVRDLSERGVVTAVLSNTSPAHWRALQKLEAVALMRHHFLSFELGCLKPDAEIYAAVERATGSEGSSILFFDDTVANVAAARARGWRAERIDFTSATAPQVRNALEIITHPTRPPVDNSG